MSEQNTTFTPEISAKKIAKSLDDISKAVAVVNNTFAMINATFKSLTSANNGRISARSKNHEKIPTTTQSKTQIMTISDRPAFFEI